jgi:hypothetical protein
MEKQNKCQNLIVGTPNPLTIGRKINFEERAPHRNKPGSAKRQLQERISRRVPDGGLTPGQTGRLTVGRKMAFTLSHVRVAIEEN